MTSFRSSFGNSSHKMSELSPFQKQCENKKTPAGVFLFRQGQKDLNPRHAVLERKARFQLSRVLKIQSSSNSA